MAAHLAGTWRNITTGMRKRNTPSLLCAQLQTETLDEDIPLLHEQHSGRDRNAVAGNSCGTSLAAAAAEGGDDSDGDDDDDDDRR